MHPDCALERRSMYAPTLYWINRYKQTIVCTHRHTCTRTIPSLARDSFLQSFFLVHTQFPFDPLGTGHTLELANSTDDPKNNGERKHTFTAQKLNHFLVSHILTVLRLAPLFVLRSPDLISQSIPAFLVFLIWIPCFIAMFGLNFIVAWSVPVSPVILPETANFHFKVSFLSPPNYRYPLFLSLIGSTRSLHRHLSFTLTPLFQSLSF